MALPPEPPDEQPPPPPPSVDAAGGECPRCGTPYDPFQEYCLECGLRLPVTRGVIPVLATAWRRRVPWYPGDWIWPVLGALVIAALAGAITILVTDEDGRAGTKAAVNETIPKTSSTNTGTFSTPTETGPTSSVPTTSVPSTSVPTEPAPPPPAAGGTLTEWPAGQEGWTVVLVSIPQTAGRPAAVREARKAISAGLTDVGVLNSSDYPALHPDYWVVFSGVFTSEQEAESGLETAKGTYSAAYVRHVQ